MPQQHRSIMTLITLAACENARIAREAARGSSKFYNFQINDPAILIQSSYFIRDFKESKSTKKRNFERGQIWKKMILRLFLYFCMLKNISTIFSQQSL